MTHEQLKIKLGHIKGLQSIVVGELHKFPSVHPIAYAPEAVYVNFIEDFKILKTLRSVARVYVVAQDERFNPSYISNHKSVLGDLVGLVVNAEFKTFKISCAGDKSPEVRSIADYITTTFKLVEANDADLKIHIAHEIEFWEVGVQITPRPLSLRSYKVNNMSGAMDPTIAYAVNSLCQLEVAHSYLNIFSGSGTLAIEAALAYPNLDKVIGFDFDKKHISLAIGNITEAGLIKRIQLYEKDIFDKPDLGKFDVVVADVPFGMAVSKGEDLEQLYTAFVDYSYSILNPNGRLAIYTSQIDLILCVISKSHFKLLTRLDAEFTSSVGAHLKAGIFIFTKKD